MPSVDVLNRRSTIFGGSLLLQSNRLTIQKCTLIGRLKRLYMVKSEASTHQVALNFNDVATVTAKVVAPIELTEDHVAGRGQRHNGGTHGLF